MAYEPQKWVNDETPITADRLNHIESGIANVETTPGSPGKDGKPGSNGKDGKSAFQIAQDNGFEGTEQEWLDSLKGAKGNTGTGKAGKDGFPTEEQYNDVLSRLAALEAAATPAEE